MSEPAFTGFVWERLQYTLMRFLFSIEFSKTLPLPPAAATQATGCPQTEWAGLPLPLPSPLHCAISRLWCPWLLWLLLCCSQDKCLPILEKIWCSQRCHFADPSTTQVLTAVMAFLTLFLYAQWVFPMAPLYPYTPHTPVVQVKMLAPLSGAQVTGLSLLSPFKMNS